MTFDRETLLHGVRQALREKNLVRVVDNRHAYQALKPGDFVEYRATFEPNVVTSLLDVLTPEILAKVVTAKLAQDRIQGVDDANERSRLYDTATLDGQLAAGVFEATQREFRNDTSAEFYGQVIPKNGSGSLAVQAVTICDKAMFDGGDTDRILDGEFRVLGKVIKTGVGYSMLDSNKILSRVKRDAIAEAEKKLVESEDLKNYMNTELNLTSDDATMHVIPIAVFI